MITKASQMTKTGHITKTSQMTKTGHITKSSLFHLVRTG